MEYQTMMTTVSKAAWELANMISPNFYGDLDDPNPAHAGQALFQTTQGFKTRVGLALLIDQRMRRHDPTETHLVELVVQVPREEYESAVLDAQGGTEEASGAEPDYTWRGGDALVYCTYCNKTHAVKDGEPQCGEAHTWIVDSRG